MLPKIKIQIDRIANRFDELLLNDNEFQVAAHDYACHQVGIETRPFTDEDEEAPWYGTYWVCYAEFHQAIALRMAQKAQSIRLWSDKE